jgi:hypothetical protein
MGAIQQLRNIFKRIAVGAILFEPKKRKKNWEEVEAGEESD